MSQDSSTAPGTAPGTGPVPAPAALDNELQSPDPPTDLRHSLNLYMSISDGPSLQRYQQYCVDNGCPSLTSLGPIQHHLRAECEGRFCGEHAEFISGFFEFAFAHDKDGPSGTGDEHWNKTSQDPKCFAVLDRFLRRIGAARQAEDEARQHVADCTAQIQQLDEEAAALEARLAQLKAGLQAKRELLATHTAALAAVWNAL